MTWPALSTPPWMLDMAQTTFKWRALHPAACYMGGCFDQRVRVIIF